MIFIFIVVEIHMKYTKEEIKESALKYATRTEFRKNDSKRYDYALRHGMLDEVCSHMVSKMRHGITDDKICEIAKKYSTRKEFREKDVTTYSLVIKRKLGDRAFAHMERIGNRYYRCIYIYKFDELNTCYIGLTRDLHIRDLGHRCPKCYSAVRDFAEKNNIEIPQPEQLTDYILKDKAAEVEKEFIEKYKNLGWNLLNKAPGGGLGGKNATIYYDKETCKLLALKYNKRTDFAKNHVTAYKYTKANGWDDYVFSHMTSVEENKQYTGKNMSEYIKKSVLHFDYKHNLIGEYESIMDACRKTNLGRTGIKLQVHHKTKYFLNGTYFKFKSDISEWHKENMKFAVKDLGVVQYDEDMNKIKQYKTLKEAGVKTGLRTVGISTACCKNIKYMGYYWKREYVE